MGDGLITKYVKRIADRRIDRLDEELDDFRRRLEQIECPHPEINYKADRDTYGLLGEDFYYNKTCTVCGKNVRQYMTREERLRDERDELEVAITHIDAQLDALLDELKK